MTPTAVPKRPILAGNALGGVHALELLVEAFPATDILVIAPPEPDRHEWQPSMAHAAQQRSVAFVQPERVNDSAVVDRIAEHEPDLLLSVYYTQIFSSELLSQVSGPALNFHPSLLPRHRGTAPLIWAIVEGDEVTGVSVHELTSGIDTGNLLYQRTLGIHPDDTGYTLHLKTANMVRAAAALLLRRLLAGNGLPEAWHQEGPPTYHSKADPRINHLDFSWPRAQVRNVVRALAPPLPGAYATVQDHRLVLERVEMVESAGASRTPGTLEIEPTTDRVLIWAEDGPLEVCAASIDGERTGGADLAGAYGIEDGVLLT